MRRVIEARRNRPMFLIDIAVPRNIEPAVNEIDNVFLYDIDDLQRVVETNVGERQEAGRAGGEDRRRGSRADDRAAAGRARWRRPS